MDFVLMRGRQEDYRNPIDGLRAVSGFRLRLRFRISIGCDGDPNPEYSSIVVVNAIDDRGLEIRVRITGLAG